jgi:predicted transcriptional regulator
MVHRIKELRAQGLTQEAIAGEVGVAQGTVSSVLRHCGMGGALLKPRKLREYP